MFINKALFTLRIRPGRQPDVTAVVGAGGTAPAAWRASRSDADPQAADQGPVEPGLHVQLPSGLGHQHACSQTSQDQ